MILVLANTKGGCGKSTLSTNIAVMRAATGDVLLIDGDDQQSSMAFTEMRTETLGTPGYTAVSLLGSNIRTQVKQMVPKYDDVVIDVGGRDTGSLRAALLVADIALIPVLPRSFDVWALDPMVKLVEEARGFNDRLKCFVVLNAADPQGKDNDDAVAVVKENTGFDALPIFIGRRKAFPNASASGLAVTEYQPRDTKACSEMASLVEQVYSGVIYANR